jgi:hypothetical protein
MNENTCKVCNKSFNSPQELQEHERNAHSSGKKEQGGQGSGEQRQQPRREDKIAS